MKKHWIAIALTSLLAAAAFVANEHKEPNAERISSSRPLRTPPVGKPRSALPPASSHPSNPEPPNDSRDAEVARKYDALLASVAPFYREPLLKMLTDREHVDPAHIESIAASERDLSTLLQEGDYALYEKLRESDIEQAHLRAFVEQLSPATRLSAQQARDLLLAKLKHKYEMQALEMQANDRSDLPPMEQGYAIDIATQGIRHYGQTFLEEARTILTEEQWNALEQFERTALSDRLTQRE